MASGFTPSGSNGVRSHFVNVFVFVVVFTSFSPSQCYGALDTLKPFREMLVHVPVAGSNCCIQSSSFPDVGYDTENIALVIGASGHMLDGVLHELFSYETIQTIFVVNQKVIQKYQSSPLIPFSEHRVCLYSPSISF